MSDPLLLIPTIDLATDADAAATARGWAARGATWLHVVARDADGTALRGLLAAVPGVAVQVAGLRTAEAMAQTVAMGAACVVVDATDEALLAAVLDSVGASRLIVALNEGTANAVATVQALKVRGVERLLYRADGAPDIAALGEVAQRGGLRVLLEADIADTASLRRVRWLHPYGVEGVVLGPALATDHLSWDEGRGI